ncbi:MAG: hypothetical protein ACR2P8_03620 [Myxococcota bacterium]
MSSVPAFSPDSLVVSVLLAPIVSVFAEPTDRIFARGRAGLPVVS